MMISDVNHQRIKTNGIWMHIAEKGSGPLVLLLHGFPETWFAWRHQIEFLASHGYHVVAPDLRGYGDTDAPISPSSYTWFHIVGDLIGLLDHFAVQQAFVVGTDWGALAAWYLSLMRPDRVKGMIAMAVPFAPRSTAVKPLDSFNQMFGDGFYICQFQKAGRAERAFARYDCLTVMKKFMLMKSDLPIAPPGMEIVDYLETPSILPSWITEEEVQEFADKFQESGFTGGLNYYRAFDLNWELLAPWQGSKITVPAKLIVGDKDIGFESAGSIASMATTTTFYNYTAFCYLIASMGLQFIWSGGLAFMDAYALLRKKVLHNPVVVGLFAVGDWVTATLSLAASASSAGITVLYFGDMGGCSLREECTKYQMAIALAFLSWITTDISSLIMLWLLAAG